MHFILSRTTQPAGIQAVYAHITYMQMKVSFCHTPAPHTWEHYLCSVWIYRRSPRSWPDPSFAAWQRIQHVNGFSVWCQWATTLLHNASDVCFGNDKFLAAIANAGRARNTFCIYFISRHLHQGKKVNFTALFLKKCILLVSLLVYNSKQLFIAKYKLKPKGLCWHGFENRHLLKLSSMHLRW